MTVSMRVMSAGTGYRYLLKSIASADGERSLSTSLTDYYSAEGRPPGRWLGRGVAAVGDGRLRAGDIVTEDQLRRLLGEGRDPVTGDPLGRSFPVYRTRQERIRTRVDALATLSGEARHTAIKRIQVEEADRQSRRAVAGFDFTFSAPKSVSVMWALADADTRATIVAAHHAAVADVIELLEREVVATRMGAAGPDGAVAQVEVEGLIATAFDHYDSRAGDPQLHTHVVIANKAKTVADGNWRSLDGRPLHAATVALSEHYNAVLADRLTRALGVVWQARVRGADRNPGWEITGVPPALMDTFSSRSDSINIAKDTLIADYISRHGHQPSPRTIIKLRQQATLATRPDKTVHSLADLTRRWHRTATAVLGQSATDWAAGVPRQLQREPVVDAGNLSDDHVAGLGAAVVDVVGERRSTWRRWNLHAEATRQTMHLRFATTADRDRAVGRIVDAAEQVSLRLTAPALATTPPEFTRADGTSMFTPRHATVFTSVALLAAEDRLLHLSDTTTGPRVAGHLLDAVTVRPDENGRRLDGGQVAALASITGSSRGLDVLVGPAGTGKTTAMRALRRVWETAHGEGSIVGLAPSAAAAQVLADDLGIATDNTAKWLHDHRRGGQRFSPGQLVIVDEASLAGTQTLDRIVGHAAEVGAKVLLVGDWAQLGAVEAGGAFGMLVRHRTDTPELHDVHRFHHDWERAASLQLRAGNHSAIQTYQAHSRIHEGDTDTMLDEVYRAWTTDLQAGRTSVMIARSSDTVRALNDRARADRIRSAQTTAHGPVGLHDGTVASDGDLIVSRRNNRALQVGRGWVKNGDRWQITTTHQDGSLTVRPVRPGGASVDLPADYVAAHVELGYAITAHRAQGATVDTAHTVVDPSMVRETLYVAMTRGREANTAYVTTDQPDAEAHVRSDGGRLAGRQVLQSILTNVGAEVSAHEALRTQHDRASSIAQLAPEYETIATAAQHQRWAALIGRSGLTPGQANAVITSGAFGALATQLRQAEATHHDPERLLLRLIAARPLDDADDPAAVLHYRLVTATRRRGGSSRPRPAARMIVGLIPQAAGPMDFEMRQALHEREVLIHQRADALLDTAIAQRHPWLRRIGRPKNAHGSTQWRRHLRTVVAYRDRYGITDPVAALGHHINSEVQRRDAAGANAAIKRTIASMLVRQAHDEPGVRLRRSGGPGRSI